MPSISSASLTTLPDHVKSHESFTAAWHRHWITQNLKLGDMYVALIKSFVFV